MNLYAFAGNDPVNGYDPSGTFKLTRVLAPFLAFFVIANGLDPSFTFLEAIGKAAETVGRTAAGSAVAGALESIRTGRPFVETFGRNFEYSSWHLAAAGVLAITVGGGLEDAGGDLFQGRIWAKKGFGGFTFGSSASIWGPWDEELLSHEFGHTLQFILLSTIGNPWGPYLALGVAGIDFSNDQTGFKWNRLPGGAIWECLSHWLGGNNGCP